MPVNDHQLRASTQLNPCATTPPEVGRALGFRAGSSSETQVRGQHSGGLGPGGHVRPPDPLSLVVERHPALEPAVDLHIGGP